MTARLLPRDELIPLLCRRCYGETIEELGEAYKLTYSQVVGLINSHGAIYKNMKAFLGRKPANPNRKDRPDPVKIIWRNCTFCSKEFVGSKFIHTCPSCKKTEEWQGAG